MRSHFLPPPGVAATCAVASALALLNGNCSAQTFIAADYATNSTYAGGWSANQNGGHGFGGWSFDGTNPDPPGQYQGIGSASPLGASWTLLNHSSTSGISDVGRAIPGGLQPGQTFETLIVNPVGYHFFRGWDIFFLNGTNNNFGGVNSGALRIQIFGYTFTGFLPNWTVDDGDGDTVSTLSPYEGAVAGTKVDLTVTSTNTYLLTMTPLSNPTNAYVQTGTLGGTNFPINWVNFRLYNTASGGLTDVSNNFSISSMTISGTKLNIQQAGTNVLLSWSTNVPAFILESSSSLVAPTVWNPVSPLPSVVNTENVVTNPIAGTQQFYRLHFQP